MLAEKFFLVLELIIRNEGYLDSPRIVSRARHVPVSLPAATR